MVETRPPPPARNFGFDVLKTFAWPGRADDPRLVVLVDARDARRLGRIDPEAGVFHAERCEKALLEELVEPLPRHLLDQVALDVDAGPVAPVRPRLERQRQLRQRVDHVLQVAGAQRPLGVVAGAAEAGGVAHQLRHRHRPGLVHRAAVLAPDLEALERRDVPGDRVVQLPAALFPQHHHRRAGDRLGHRGDAEDAVDLSRRGVRVGGVEHAVGVEVHDLAVARHQGDDVGELPVVDQLVEPGVEGGEALGGEALEVGGAACGDGGLIVRHVQIP